MQHIHISIVVKQNGASFFMSAIFGYPQSHLKHLTRVMLQQLKLIDLTSRLAIGDFNRIMEPQDKSGAPLQT